MDDDHRREARYWMWVVLGVGVPAVTLAVLMGVILVTGRISY
jgi:hypothetical protein